MGGVKRSRIALPVKEYKRLCIRVYQRDNYRCQVPGCGTRKNLHAHHIVFRSQQGDDVQENLITVCDPCHHAIHFTGKKRGEGVVILPLKEGEEINANKGVRWFFVNGWKPTKTW